MQPRLAEGGRNIRCHFGVKSCHQLEGATNSRVGTSAKTLIIFFAELSWKQLVRRSGPSEAGRLEFLVR